ncbi:MAG: hypothetical protein WCP22_13735, partial [Chlamydiota bacterium]
MIRKCVMSLVAVAILPLGTPLFAQAAAGAGTKVLVPADRPGAAAEIVRQGGSLIARRGAYDVYVVGSARLNALSSLEGVEARPDFDRIMLHRGAIDTTKTAPAAPAAMNSLASGPRLMLVQFAAPPVDGDLEMLAGSGARVVQYIPENAYLIWGGDEAGAALRNRMGAGGALQFLGEYYPYYALSPRLDAATQQDSLAMITVQFFNYGPGALADAERLAAAAAKVIDPPREALDGRYLNARLAVSGADIPAITKLPGVVWVEPYVPP